MQVASTPAYSGNSHDAVDDCGYSRHSGTAPQGIIRPSNHTGCINVCCDIASIELHYKSVVLRFGKENSFRDLSICDKAVIVNEKDR
jgi:hypothetical protein